MPFSIDSHPMVCCGMSTWLGSDKPSVSLQADGSCGIREERPFAKVWVKYCSSLTQQRKRRGKEQARRTWDATQWTAHTAHRTWKRSKKGRRCCLKDIFLEEYLTVAGKEEEMERKRSEGLIWEGQIWDQVKPPVLIHHVLSPPLPLHCYPRTTLWTLLMVNSDQSEFYFSPHLL